MTGLSKMMRNRSDILLILLWLALTVLNINKAFHIDDSFHLESAEWIAEHPLHPMSGYINWYNDPEHMYHFNQPPLLFYLIAITGEKFGYSEIPLHLMLSVFTFLALVYFRRIARLFHPYQSDLLLSLFALSPALFINQNLMTDMPILALELGFFYHIIKSDETPGIRDHMLAAVFLSLSLLIKYAMIPLIPVFIISILLKKRYRSLWTVLIPIGTLVIWSLFNIWEYGGIHILDRPKNAIIWQNIYEQFVAFVACLGCLSVFSIAVLDGITRKQALRILWMLLPLGGLIYTFLNHNGTFNMDGSGAFLRTAFLINGAVILITLIAYFIRDTRIALKTGKIDFKYSVTYIWFGFIGGFMIVYAPFMASRHIMLILPALLILLGNTIQSAYHWVKTLAVTCTLFMGMVLGISDWYYADFYRTMAANIEIPEGQKVWHTGHWGWQWYANKNGMTQYSTDSSIIEDGDYLVYPVDVSRQNISDRHYLKTVRKTWLKHSDNTFFSVDNFAAMYNSYIWKGPWEFNYRPVDTIVVCRIYNKTSGSEKNSD